MPRRRLRVVSSSSSDEDDDVVSIQPPPPPPSHQIPHILPEEASEEEDQIINDDVGTRLQTVTLSSSNSTSNTNSNSHNPTRITEPIPFHISDDDVDDAIMNDVPDPDSINPSTVIGNTNFVSSNPNCDGIDGILRRKGLNLKREWFDGCIGALEREVPGFSGNSDDLVKAKICFQQFLNVDMNFCGAGVLPSNVASLHLVDLKGPFVLQVDEIVNISCPLKDRYQEMAAGVKRCLKLSMTDGVQRISGMEYRPIKALEVLSPAGMKVAICNVNVRRGILMLVPEVIEVLGGKVEELDAARQRLVQEVNKPPRGKRTRTGVVPPLATRATRAAWPAETVNVQEHIYNSRTTMPLQVEEPGIASGIPASDGTEDRHRTDAQAISPSATETNEVHMATESEQDVDRINREQNAVSSFREEAGPNLYSSATTDVQEAHMLDELEHPFLLTGDNESPFTYLASLLAMWAAKQGDVARVEGKIKCFLTGVKGFQYKRRTTYELLVYIDDGSLISEILIDHNVVQKGIGYSPEEVCAALASSDARRVSEMKETLKQFQSFLVNFEGTMLVEITATSSIPVATEMNQGCPASDAWLLLERLGRCGSAQHQHQQNSHLNAIVLSP
ncbi:recQ-mediated genome instability protein 1 [Coffea eugenioides]|uniref:RecQ-mediated genome instability protein 1 n=1 Tax=Coffea arabica TaxID=13443 RepID=A0ABM4VVA7_COFAR|nr:recQ-mediated genome instability protein 1 [Coffea eugenioides]